MKNRFAEAQQKLMTAAAQLSDPVLKQNCLELIQNLKNPNARTDLEGIVTQLSTDLRNDTDYNLVPFMQASIAKIHEAEIDNAKKKSRHSSEAANG